MASNRKEQDMANNRTCKVTKYAFVMPVYDYDIVDNPSTGYFTDLWIPCEDKHMVSYNVYGWVYEEQSWECIGSEDYYQGAKEIADKYNKKMEEEENSLELLHI